MRPSPVWDGTRWRVDLRTPWHLGRHVVEAPPPPHGLVEAIHAARDLLEQLRERACSPQLGLPGTGGRTIAHAFKIYLAERSYRKEGGKKWVCETAAAICREIGAEPLVVLAPPGGAKWLAAWVRAVRASERKRKVGPRAMKDRLAVLSKFARWCAHADRLWLPAVPEFPDPRLDPSERLHNPRSEWVEEAQFRAVRDAIFLHPLSLAILMRHHKTREAVADYIARRRVFLSLGFYTGMRRADLEEVRGRHISPDCRCVVRSASKCSIKPEWERICEPLVCDLLAERARLGRHWHDDESVTGGSWRVAPRAIRIAAKSLGMPGFDLRTLRRSFVRMKALAGVAESDLTRLMGHAADSRMVREVYLRVPPPNLMDPAGEAWPGTASDAPTAPPARRLHLVPSEDGGGGASAASGHRRR